MKQVKPMLAYTVKDVNSLSYPVIASPKLDGIRCIVMDGVCYSRSLKPIRSEAVQRKFGKPEYNGFDGELIYGDVTDEQVFNKTTQVVMSKNMPEWADEVCINFHVFDIYNSQKTAKERKDDISLCDGEGIVHVTGKYVYSSEEVEALHEHYLSLGFEGVMVMYPEGKYKFGRSTAKEGLLGKIKAFTDDDAVIVGCEELMTNTNEAQVNELGYTERSQCKDGLVGQNTLGSLVCKTKDGIEFKIGTGFDAKTRLSLWEQRDSLVGKWAKYKHFVIGAVDAPRFPVFLGVRDEDDMS